MSRIIDTNLLAALTGSVTEPFMAVELLFDTRIITDVNGNTLNVGPLRLWTGLGTRTINLSGVNSDFLGTGQLLGISGFDEVNDLAAKSLTLTLSGIDISVISLALKEPYQRRKARVYLGEKNTSEVVQVFSGIMDKMQIIDEGETSTISLTIESALIELERARNWRYTDESHKTRYSNDSFFSYVQSIQDVSVPWGRKS
jgi:hypothetical protein